jgi:hypothetical protein
MDASDDVLQSPTQELDIKANIHDGVSIMMLDESDRDLIATQLAVLEASAEDIIWVCAEAMCNCT